MRVSTLLGACASLVWGAQAYTSIGSTAFNDIKCATGVLYTYSNGCTARSITNCGKTWGFLNNVQISDGNGGTILVSYLKRDDLKEIYVVFPGSNGDNNNSNYGADVNTTQVSYTFNGSCSGCMVHGGFIKAFNLGKNTVINYAKFFLNSPGYSDYKFVVTGGSLGGALASLLWAELYGNWGYNLFPTRAITVGQPRVGNGQYAAYMNKLTDASGTPKYTRITHGQDAIPRSPIYGSSGQTYLQHNGETWEKDDVNNGNRPSAATTVFCPLGGFGSEPTDCVNGGPGYIGDHVTYAGYAFNNEAPACPSS